MGDYYDGDDDDGAVMGPNGEVDLEDVEDSASEEEEEEEEDEEMEELDEDAAPIEVEGDEIEKSNLPTTYDFSLLNSDKADSNHRYVEIVAPEERITSEIIQLPEMTEAIGIRISQIENGMPAFVNTDGLTNAIDMARKEFFEGQNPLVLRRIIQQREGLNVVEDWNVCEMSHPAQSRHFIASLQKITHMERHPAAAPIKAAIELKKKTVKAEKDAKAKKDAQA